MKPNTIWSHFLGHTSHIRSAPLCVADGSCRDSADMDPARPSRSSASPQLWSRVCCTHSLLHLKTVKCLLHWLFFFAIVGENVHGSVDLLQGLWAKTLPVFLLVSFLNEWVTLKDRNTSLSQRKGQVSLLSWRLKVLFHSGAKGGFSCSLL